MWITGVEILEVESRSMCLCFREAKWASRRTVLQSMKYVLPLTRCSAILPFLYLLILDFFYLQRINLFYSIVYCDKLSLLEY